ncbi:response regulator transcription factor [Maritimibacter sp. DP1N21-5]|uniref:response regulator transcription factor n=1 Tax=Maritimibacter sp. DP1N21-5 TaxID=2836867 RepID=UPI0021027343|nr:LuxR C-terminal-related transcriptional regulator [Maritimibacter sp. DP1N21-5]
MPDLATWDLIRSQTEDYEGLIQRVLIVDEREVGRLAQFLDRDAALTRDVQIAVAVRSDDSARALLADNSHILSYENVSVLPMNLNLASWIQLVRLIDCGTRYVPSFYMKSLAGEGESEPPSRPEPPPRVVSMRAGSRPVQQASDAAQADEPVAEPPAVTRKSLDSDDTPAVVKRKLTPRETEVLKLVASGQPNKVIARDLDVSCHTVKLHIHRIIAKLGVNNRTEAAVWYHQTLHG